jgi:hypothetical protein
MAARSQHRAAGEMDLLTAAAAEHYGASILHYDTDFEHIAAVTGQPVEWVAPRGSCRKQLATRPAHSPRRNRILQTPLTPGPAIRPSQPGLLVEHEFLGLVQFPRPGAGVSGVEGEGRLVKVVLGGQPGRTPVRRLGRFLQLALAAIQGSLRARGSDL